MAVVRLRPKGKRNPELRFHGKTAAGALAAAKGYMRRHNIAGFTDAGGVFHPIRGSRGYKPKRVGEHRRKTKRKIRRKRNRAKARRRRRNYRTVPFDGVVAFDVYLGGKNIDTVFYSDRKTTVDEVKRSLVGHDGYDPAIVVKKRKRKRSTS